MRTFKNNQKGFTLVEIMVAVGLLGGLAVAGMTMFKNQTEAQKTVEANYEVTTTFSQLRVVLADITNCSQTFSGQNPSGGSVSVIRKGTPVENVYQTNTQLPGNIRINSYRLTKSFPGLASNEAILRVSFSRGKSAIKDEITKNLKIVYTGGATIASCYAFNNNSDSYWVQSSTDPNDIVYMGGDVGIGISNPQQKLAVGGNIQVGADNLGVSAVGDKVIFSDNTNNTDHVSIHRINTSSDVSYLKLSVGDNASWGQPGYQDAVLIGDSSTNTIGLFTNGMVGIGTVTPSASLDVVGTLQLGRNDAGTGIISATANDTIIRPRIDTSGRIWLADTNTNGRLEVYNAGVSYIDSRDASNNPTNIGIGSLAGNSVGIGTVAPSHRLQVVGGISSRNTTASDGFITMQPGDSGVQGYLEWYRPGPQRMAYMGHAPYGAGNIGLVLENGANFIVGNGNTGIGTTSMWGRFNVNGRSYFQANSEPYAIGVGRTDNGGAWYYMGVAGADLVFSNNGGTEWMRVRNDGNVGIGTASPGDKLSVNGKAEVYTASNDHGLRVRADASNNHAILQFTDLGASAQWGTIHTTAGEMILNQNRVRAANEMHAAIFYYSSDKTLKKEIETYPNALDQVSKLRGVNFTWKKGDIKDVGFIAQEVEKVEPRLVTTGPDGKKSVKYGNIVAMVVEAVKEIKEMVLKLFTRQDEMEKQIVELKKENELLRKHLELQEKRLNAHEAQLNQKSN